MGWMKFQDVVDAMLVLHTRTVLPDGVFHHNAFSHFVETTPTAPQLTRIRSFTLATICAAAYCIAVTTKDEDEEGEAEEGAK